MTRSIVEAEYMTMLYGTCELLKIKILLAKLGFSIGSDM